MAGQADAAQIAKRRSRPVAKWRQNLGRVVASTRGVALFRNTVSYGFPILWRSHWRSLCGLEARASPQTPVESGVGVDGDRCCPRSSKPLWGYVVVLGGFDPHALPPLQTKGFVVLSARVKRWLHQQLPPDCRPQKRRHRPRCLLLARAKRGRQHSIERFSGG